MPPPSWIQNEPGILPRDEFYLDAFWDLCTCRNNNMSLGAIPWRDIVAYAEYHELESDVFKSFVLTIRAMDKVFLEWYDKKNQSEENSSKSRRRRSGKPRQRRR